MQTRCTCSVRALEAFVRDFAGLAVRNTPAGNALRRPRNVRALRTRPAVGLQHSVSVQRSELRGVRAGAEGLDDAFVPFEIGGQGARLEGVGAAGVSGRGRNHDARPVLEREGVEELEGFEPEVEILDDAEVVAEARAEDEKANGAQAGERESDGNSEGIEQGTEAQTTTRSREENRKARKLRRMEAKRAEQQAAKANSKPAKQQTTSKARSKPAKQQTTSKARSKPARKVTDKELVHLEKKHEHRVKKASKIVASLAEPEEAVLPAKAPTAAEEAVDADADAREKKQQEPWGVYKSVLEQKFGDQGWQPRKRISPDALSGIRALHQQQPDVFTTPVLAEHFKVSPEAIRRILKSKWQASEDETEDRRKRWEKRGERKWNEMVEQGIRPPKKWREMGVGSTRGSGEKPAWKRGGARRAEGLGAGERWIEAPETDTFVIAGDVAADADEVGIRE